MQAQRAFAGALLCLLFAAPLLHADGFANPALKPSNPPLQNARVDGIDVDNGKIAITDCPQLRSAPNSRPICEGSSFYLTVDDEALRTKIRNIHVGDHIRIDFTLPSDKPGSPPPYKVIGVAGIAAPQISSTYRVVVLFGSFALTFLLGAAMTGWQPLNLILGMDNRYSNSKLQAALWFWVLITSYLEFLYIRVAAGGLDFLGGISIPQNLLLLSGMSAVTFAGAKGITTAKANAYEDAETARREKEQNQANAPVIAAAAAAAAVESNADDGNAEIVAVASTPQGAAAAAAPAGATSQSGPMATVIAAPEPQPLPRPRRKTARPHGERRELWKDLMQNDLGSFDFGDFQMVIVTMLAVGTYMLSVHHALGAVQLAANTSLPDLDTTILSAFGIGQGAYLAKKAVGNASAS